MKKTTPQTITLKGLYNEYKDKLPLTASFSVYHDIWKTLNEAIVDSVIEGNVEKISHSLGNLKIVRIKNKPRVNANGKLLHPINWGKTKELRGAGKLEENKFFYSIQEYRCRFTLKKGKGRLRGYKAYTFKPSRTNGTTSKTGAINKLCSYLLENSINYLRFPLKK
jgi:hypothetical protein